MEKFFFNVMLFVSVLLLMVGIFKSFILIIVIFFVLVVVL